MKQLLEIFVCAAVMLAAEVPPAQAGTSPQGVPTLAASGPLSTIAEIQSARVWRTRHKGTFGGRQIDYTATAEIVPVTGADGVPDATFFTVTYEARSKPGVERPIIFAFNGGPGSSAIWLHMGLLGPRVVRFGNDLKPETVPPFRLADNPDCVLDVADIVLIDPPGTGYARLRPGTDPGRYYGVDADAVAFANVIERWIATRGRANAPKYVLGESYGSIRASVLADLLAGGGVTGQMNGVSLNGVIIMGQALDLAAAAHGDRSYLTSLPSIAASAWFFRKGSLTASSAQQAYNLAAAFVRDTYLGALFDGNLINDTERRKILKRLAEITGLSTEIIDRNNLRVSPALFARNLLLDPPRNVGMYDSRFTLTWETIPSGNLADDPSMGQYVPGYVSAMSTYLRDELGVQQLLLYVPIDFSQVNSAWDYGDGKGVPMTANYAPRLAMAMRRNPQLRVLMLSGRYDLVTPSAETHYVAAHNEFPTSRTTLIDYDSGHMPYLGGTRAALAADLRHFVAASR